MIKAPSVIKAVTGIISNLFRFAKSALWNLQSAWVVLLVGLMITATAALYMKSSVESIAKREFAFECNEITNKISERLDDHASILQSGAALFNASDVVTRIEWHVFNQRQKIEKQLPGIQGIGFSLLIPRSELTRHIQNLRREGFPQYKLKPDGDRKVYSSIIYLEPFSGRNLLAFGYDMLSEPVRRSAMERARDTDAAALSGKVVLVQETGTDVQAGTLMYFPVYRKGMPIETVEERRDAIYGWVYSPYRMNDLMQGILGGLNLEKEKQIHLQVFDGVQPSPRSLLYDSLSAGDRQLLPDGRFSRQIPVDFNGQRWTLSFTQTGGGFSTAGYIRVWLILAGGIIVTLLLFALIRVLLNTRAEAQRIADKMTRELSASESHFRLLADNSTDVIWTMTLDGRFTYVSPSVIDLSGFTPQEAMEIPFHKYIVESYVEPVMAELAAQLQKPPSERLQYFSIEAQQYCKDGSVKDVDIVADWILDERNCPIGIQGSTRDISERKAAQNALKQTRQNYEAFFNTIDEFLFVLDEQGNIMRTNTTVTDRLGYSTEELQGQSVLMVHPPERREEAGRIVGQMLNGSAEFCPIPLITKSGVQIPVETRVFRGFWDGKPVIFGVTKDISQIRLSEEKFSKVFHINPSICGLSDLDTGKYIEVNEAFYNLLGFYKNEVIGKTAIELGILNPETTNAILLKANSERNVTNVEADLKAKNGDIMHVLLSSENIYVQDKKYRFTIAHDITAQKNAEAEKVNLEVQNRQLQKTESLSLMAAAIAHHFNNQLGVVIGYLEMAIEELPKGSALANILTSAIQSAWKSADMSGLMLTYLGQSTDKREPMDISYSCRKILPILKAAMPENVILETNFSSPGPVISTNTDYVQQIFTNLINNAWEAIGKNNGSISLIVKTVSPVEIPEKNRFPIDWRSQDNTYACLEVTDTGCGIEGKDIEKIFDPFYSTKFTGRGMGLAVVLGIVRTHKGVLTVESKPKQGSTFRVFVPLSEEALPQTQKDESKDDSLNSAVFQGKFEEGGTVLMTEDEEPMRKMVAIMLKRLGFSVLEAKDGIEALEIFGRHQGEIKFVLTDLTMPRMGGWETLTALRKLQPDIPIILASGYDLAHVMEGDHPELPQAFLNKPYNLKALSDAIRQVIDRLKER